MHISLGRRLSKLSNVHPAVGFSSCHLNLPSDILAHLLSAFELAEKGWIHAVQALRLILRAHGPLLLKLPEQVQQISIASLDNVHMHSLATG